MWGVVGSNLYSWKLVIFLEQITPFYKESRNQTNVKDKDPAPIVYAIYGTFSYAILG